MLFLMLGNPEIWKALNEADVLVWIKLQILSPPQDRKSCGGHLFIGP